MCFNIIELNICRYCIARHQTLAMASKKVSQSEMRQMMQKLKAEKGGGESQDRKRKYKLGTKELALMEMEKKRKLEEKKSTAKKAGVPDNFFDSAKTKAFLNLGKAPQKSILKNTGAGAGAKPVRSNLPQANVKATGSEWTSSGPVINEEAVAAAAQNKKEKSPQKTLLRTPSGGTINHLQEEMEEVAAPGSSARVDQGDLPEGFFDDPVMDAKARGVEYKDAEQAEWEAFQKEIAVEVAASTQMTAEEQLEETTDRQLEEIDDQMRAWSRVRDIEIMKDEVEEKLKVKKTVTAELKQENSDDELDEESLEEFLDWRQKKT